MGTWLEDKTLRELALISEGVLVLSIERGGGIVLGTPGPKSLVHEGDQLLLYGQEADRTLLAKRAGGTAGDEAHELAVEKQRMRRA